MDEFLKGLRNEKFKIVNPKKYALDLREKFIQNPLLWYEVIIPHDKAEELIIQTNNNYSEIWHEHCACCFCPIDKNTLEDCYISEDKLTWLCKKCYGKLFGDFN